MKIFKKFICILMAAVLISISPLSDYTIINDMQTVEASATAIGGATVLALVLAGLGVYVSSDARKVVAEEFGDWLSENASAESMEEWVNSDASTFVTITPRIVQNITDWASTKFVSLKSGGVSSVDTVSSNTGGSFKSVYSELAYKHFMSETFSSIDFDTYNYFIYSSDYSSGGSITCILFPKSYYVHFPSRSFLFINNGIVSGVYSFISTSYYAASIDNSSLAYSCSLYSSKPSLPSNLFTDGLFYETNMPILTYENKPSSGAYISDLIAVGATLTNASTYVSSMTSFGNYVQDNMNALAGLTFSSALVSNVLERVTDSIDANKVVDATGSVTYADDIAQIVADAYAAGLADAKAEQGTIEDEKEESEKDVVTTGWLSNIYDSVVALPGTIYDSFSSTLTDGIGILSDVFQATEDVKELITTIPTTIVEEFTEVFPTAESVTELITSIPASIVDALVDVFPVAEDLEELISTVPADIVDAISAGVGVIADGLAATKEAVLAIPAAVVDGITVVLEKLFVPDLTLAEAEIANISNSLGWVTTLNTLVNDFMLKLEAGEPPTLYLDFTKAEDNKYHGAGKVLAIDFSWYAKYKPTGDLVFSSFLWVVFLWYLFKRVPDIISGAGFITRGSINSDNRSSSKNDSGAVPGSGKYFRHGGGSSL